MILINLQYDVILTYSPIPEITGHIFECFDYYLFLRNYCKVGILFFYKFKNNFLKTAFESKYNELYENIANDIIFLDNINITGKTIILFYKNTRVIVTDGNIYSLENNNIILAAKRLYGFLCDLNDSYNSKLHNHITFLLDYRIYKSSSFITCNYVKKIPFLFYKNITCTAKNIGLIYMTFICRKITPELVQYYHNISSCEKSILLVPYKILEYDTLNGITLVQAPLNNFFEQFDTYIYTPVARKFDCSPRLITECFYYNKKIIKNINYYDIGLETRYNDCISCFLSLILNDNDDILRILNIK